MPLSVAAVKQSEVAELQAMFQEYVRLLITSMRGKCGLRGVRGVRDLRVHMRAYVPDVVDMIASLTKGLTRCLSRLF